MAENCHVHVIFYSEETRAAIEPGYLGLDNTGNIRPDWREYWPIRNFLRTASLQEDAFYGFFSPRFREKTDLSAQQVLDFVAAAAEADIVTFSPQVDIGAFFRNGFLGSEFADPGSLDLAQAFVDRLGLEISLRHALMDSRNTIFSNYFVARPWVWRKWFALAERLFDIAEFGAEDDTLRRGLLSATGYENVTGGQIPVQRKVFLLEGIISILLLLLPAIRIRQFNPFKLNWSSQLVSFHEEAIACDALKSAARERGFPEYLAIHDAISTRVLAAAFGKGQALPSAQTLLAGEQTNTALFALLPDKLMRVVEIGKQTQSFGMQYLARSSHSRWTCYEPERAIALADPQDVDAWVLQDSFGGLEDPQGFLAGLRGQMSGSAAVYACVSNLQHWSMVGQIVAGRLGTEASQGRYYTRRQVLEIFAGAGFSIVQFIGRTAPVPQEEPYLKQIECLARLSGADVATATTEASVLQFVIRAVPSTAA